MPSLKKIISLKYRASMPFALSDKLRIRKSRVNREETDSVNCKYAELV